MIIVIIARAISFLANVIVLLVIVSSILSYFLNPFHPVRRTLDRIVDPLLAPIRRVVPAVGMLDLSPLVLIVLVEIFSFALTYFLYALR